MNLKTRKRLSLLLLVLGLPGYIVVAWMLSAWVNDSFGRLPIWAELLLFVALVLLRTQTEIRARRMRVLLARERMG